MSASFCSPNEAIAAMAPDREALNARAMALLDSKPTVVPAPAQVMNPEKRIDPAEQFPGRRLGR